MVVRILLAVVSLIFIAIGVAFLVAPKAMGKTVEIEITTATAEADFAATYGGFDLAFGIFLALCLWVPAWNRVGLVAAGLILAGFGGARLVWILKAGGAVKPLLYWLLAIEIVGAIGCFLAFARSRD